MLQKGPKSTFFGASAGGVYSTPPIPNLLTDGEGLAAPAKNFTPTVGPIGSRFYGQQNWQPDSDGGNAIMPTEFFG